MKNVKAEIERALATCENQAEVIAMVSGTLLGLLGKITGEQFDLDEASVNTWPKLLAEAVQRVAKMPERSAPLDDWFHGAGELLVTLHRAYSETAAN
jgi:hypothetical protein